MKSLLIASCLIWLAWPFSVPPPIVSGTPTDLSKTETIRMESSFSRLNASSTLMLKNINGSVVIEGYSGNRVKVEILKRVEGKSMAIVKKGLDELRIVEDLRGDTLELVLDFPWVRNEQFQGKWQGNHGFYRDGWSWNPDYEFQLDFKIKVPHQLNLYVSTVNQGRLEVRKVRGDLAVKHVNGGIDLMDVEGKVHARTINGDVTLTYARLPREDSHFSSHNGTIRLQCPKGLSARMFFKSRHGEFYTNLDQLRMSQEEVKQIRKEGEAGIRYAIGSRTAMISRNGSVDLDFETFNGNVYVEEIN